MEIWDSYRRDASRTDTKLVRGEPIPAGLYHLVGEVLVRHRDGSYLCMKRSREKPLFPGRYEATAGGSALAGEDAWQCVRRELREETGICGGQWQSLGLVIDDGAQCIYHMFLCVVDVPKDAVRLQSGETEDYVWMTEGEFAAFVRSGEMIDRQRRRFAAYFTEKGYLREELE